MSSFRTPGSLNGYGKPVDINDGTNNRFAMPTPGHVEMRDSWSIRDYWRRIGYVEDALEICGRKYAAAAIIKQVGEDAWGILTGIFVGLLMAAGVLVLSVGVGALVGGAIGFFGGGVTAVPGAVAGAEIGLTIGNGILAWAGVAFLAVYVVSHLGEMGLRFHSGITVAWNSRGNPAAIDAAAHEFAEGVGYFVSLLIQAIVLYLTKSVNKQGTAKAWTQLRDSLLFKRCRGLEPWLIKNFPKLRAKYVPLKWTVLKEGPIIPNTSIPESMNIKVGEREFEVFRNKDALNKAGEKIGPATKHLGERAEKANSWSKIAQTDFPISSLAAALDQAEAQLIFQPPNPRAKPVQLDGWELIIDTTGPVWRVFHAVYTDKPQW